MIQFIFCFPIIFLIVRKSKTIGLPLCAIITLSYEVLKNMAGMNESCYRLLLFRYVFVIAYGCYIALYGSTFRKITETILFLIGTLYILFYVYLDNIPPITYYWTGTSIWACLYLIPIARCLINNDMLRNPLFELLGRASFNIFLVQMVYYNGAWLIYPLLPNRFLQLTINILVCTFFGVVFYYVESPITKKLVQILKRNNTCYRVD